MNAHARKAALIDVGCLGIVVIYLMIGLAVHLLIFGKPDGFSISSLVAVILWPLVLIWWAINWIAFVITFLLLRRGLKSFIEEAW